MKFGLKPNQPERYTATMILDSVSPDAIRLPTMHVTMPRIILAELNTHRRLTRNSRSTRAVPTSKLIQEVSENPYRPLYWLKNKPGMQATEAMSPSEIVMAERAWLRAAATAASDATLLFGLGLHKQFSGRVLEPFMFTDVLLSATEWANFMALRDDDGAQPEIELVAQRIRDCLDSSTPKLLQPGEWHMPYIRDEDWPLIRAHLRTLYDTEDEVEERQDAAALHVSAARCARLSYRPFNGEASIKAELERFDGLATSWPVHASPTEHQATPDQRKANGIGGYNGWWQPEDHRNFRGWRQHRALIDGETVTVMPARRHPLPNLAA